MLICLVWKLSPRETIPLEVSLSFKWTLQLSPSLMTMSIIVVLSSLSGMALSAGNAAVGVVSLEPYFLLSYAPVPGVSIEEAFHFQALESIHQALPFSVSKVYLQVNTNNRCRNWSFMCQGLRKKILSEKTSDCVINLTLCKEKYLYCNWLPICFIFQHLLLRLWTLCGQEPALPPRPIAVLLPLMSVSLDQSTSLVSDQRHST